MPLADLANAQADCDSPKKSSFINRPPTVFRRHYRTRLYRLKCRRFHARRNRMYDPRILSALRENYHNCTSYEDVGTIFTEMKFDETVQTDRFQFSTTFIRPAMVRFEIQGAQSKTVLQANGDSIRDLHYGEQNELTVVSLYPNLAKAIDTLRGVTQGVFPIIFGLLTELTDPNLFDSLSNMDRKADDIIDGQEVYQIFGELGDMGTYTLWISKNSNVLRCVETIMNESVAEKANLVAKPIVEAEGSEWTDIPPCTFKTIYNFEQITFNNGITIDAIG